MRTILFILALSLSGCAAHNYQQQSWATRNFPQAKFYCQQQTAYTLRQAAGNGPIHPWDFNDLMQSCLNSEGYL